MIGTDLNELRAHIERLASETGEYYLVCGRFGDRPVPAAGLRFETRAVARVAARAAEQYRQALRRYDPRLPYYDIIVCQDLHARARSQNKIYDESGEKQEVTENSESREVPESGQERGIAGSGESREVSETDVPREPVGPLGGRERPASALDDTPSRTDRRIEFCHRVAAAVFETLAASDRDDIQSAVMDAYVTLAETVSDPDDLCVCLLESMATELDTRLTPGEQAQLLAAVARRIGAITAAEGEDTPENRSAPADATALPTVIDRLQTVGLLDGYTLSPTDSSADDSGVSHGVVLSEYALSPQDGRLPTLPFAVEFARLTGGQCPTQISVKGTADGWHVQFVVESEATPTTLVNPTIQRDVS
jgi:hypothetical protein